MSQNQDNMQRVSVFRKIFIVGIILNLAYLLVEAVVGLCIQSSGLLSDAVQNLCDVAGMVIVLSAFRFADPGGTFRFTYKYKRAIMIMVALVTLVVGALTACVIAGSIHQFQSHYPVDGKLVAIVAGVGVVVNSFTAAMFLAFHHRQQRKGKVFRHMVADALVSLVVMSSGLIMLYDKWYMLDALIGLAVILVTAFALWELLRHCFRTVLDGVADGVNYENLVCAFYDVEGVVDVHHLHIWSVGAAENVLTAKVVLQNLDMAESVQKKLKEKLTTEGISETTLEFETSSNL